MPGTTKSDRTSVRHVTEGPVLDLNKYVPGLFTLIASKLSGGASTAYLSLYAVGIETWRVMVMLAIEGRISAQRMVQLLDADKGAVSRTFKAMHAQGLLEFEPDEKDGRVRHAVFTKTGRDLHNRVIRLAIMREEIALSVLSDTEVETLRDLLRRVYMNLPNVETASAEFIRLERASLGMPADAPALRRRGASRQEAGTPSAPSKSAKNRSEKNKPGPRR